MQQPQGIQRLLKTGQQEIRRCFSPNPLSRTYKNPTTGDSNFLGTFREHHLSAKHTYKYSRRYCPRCLTGLELNQLSLQIIVFLVSYKPVPVASNRTWQQPGCYIRFGSVVQLLHPLLHLLTWSQQELSFWGSYLTTWNHKKPQNPLTNNSFEHCSQFWHHLPHVWSWAFFTAVTFDKMRYEEVIHSHSLQPKHGNPTHPTNTTEQYPSDYRLIRERLQFRPCQISSAYWKPILRASSCSSFDICPVVVAIHNGSHISSRII